MLSVNEKKGTIRLGCFGRTRQPTLADLNLAVSSLGFNMDEFLTLYGGNANDAAGPRDGNESDSSEDDEYSDDDDALSEDHHHNDPDHHHDPDRDARTEAVTYLQYDDLLTCEIKKFELDDRDEVFSLKGKKLELIEEIGKGSQATVWKGTIDGRHVALKQVDLSGARDRNEVRNAIKYEVDMMRKFNHKNIIRYFGSFFSKRTQELNIITELIPGGSLTRWIHTFGRFSETLAAHVIHQTLNGLLFLHSHLILHRDLKPDNLLVDVDGTIKLVDFGIAVQMCDELSYRMSSVGTPWYTAPEVINGEEYSFPCDVWSLGCTLIELLTGKPPFHHLNAVEALFAMTEEMPSVPADASSHCRDFLGTIFVREWKNRATAASLLQHPYLTSSLLNGQEDSIFLCNVNGL